MPQINQNLIRYGAEDALAGLAPQYQLNLGSRVAPVGVNGLFVGINHDPFRGLGLFAPGTAPTNFTNDNVIDQLLMSVSWASESSIKYGYSIDLGGNLQRFEPVTHTFSNAGSWPHAITDATVGSDTATYTINVSSTPTQGVFYSYQTASGWDIGLFDTSSGNFDDDWMSTVPANPISTSASDNPIPMIIGKDDVLYFANGNIIYGLDGQQGTDGTVFTALTIPSGYIITSFAKLGDRLAIFAYQDPGESFFVDTVYGYGAICAIWNYLDLDPEQVIELDTDVVSCAFTYGGSIGCITTSCATTRSLNTTQKFNTVRIYDGSRFVPVCEFPGEPPSKNGVDVINDAIVWSADGNIYSYGTLVLGIKEGLNQLTQGSGSLPGVCLYLPGTSGRLAASSTNSFEFFNTGFVANATVSMPVAQPALDPGKIGRVKNITFCFAKNATNGREVELGITTDNGTVTRLIANLSTIDDSNIVSKFQFTSAGAEMPRFTWIRPYIIWRSGGGPTDAPIVKYVEIEWYQDQNKPTPSE